MVSAEKTGLDLGPFMAKTAPATPAYNLYAVLNHYGGLAGGHYTAVAKNHASGRWFLFDDSRCQALADEDDEPPTSCKNGDDKEAAAVAKEQPTLASARLLTPAAYVLCYAAADTPASDLLQQGGGADENGESVSDADEEGTYCSVA
eukprot:TRINITY_DN1254_c0_g1_i3.p1 TRINITY_DN1254_c0_g1~~TRINITY_DN1254_c0_g1_i3.p1  ORF type:complete len:147 (+),score=33.88 TRINITY_DN1254_c0_g1_i3:129-569(+)